MKGRKMRCNAPTDHKKGGVAILISDKTYFRAKTISQDKEDIFIIMNQFTKKMYKYQRFMYLITEVQNTAAKLVKNKVKHINPPL